MSRYISPVLYILMMLIGCVAFISIAGVRVGFIEPITAFDMLRKTVLAAIALTILTLVSLFVCRKECSAGGRRFFWLVCVVSFIYSVMWLGLYMQKSKLPDLYDITTDLNNPPVFINMAYLRKASEHDLNYDFSWVPIQKKYYPKIKPLEVSNSFQETYIEAASLVSERGWDMVAQYPSAGVIEATARTPIFGLRNDIVIRITSQNDKVIVDMRSCSRAGESDHGNNAERIQGFLGQLSKRLTPVPDDLVLRN
ncbi:hypothetical protein MAQ5080_02604 [Marinomonas aquimarina]|uniref:DUF1499 domain-containing protein n=1 Tax=Marinomonas aquimarina TaxID=295068 RepID=A0A1A8TLW4_9GAMM|nr:DUF1499 domain-containing protein [Marinomonas aquimarina]SBS33514.1 hypothetical protein MAQ5080_02604 [Marinomonas aquimarina]